MDQTYLMMQKATQETMSPAEASRVLKENACFRTLSEKLQRYAPNTDLRAVLCRGMKENHPEASADSIERKVRMWLSPGSTMTIARPTAIELGFILGLDLDAADGLLAMLTDSGYHWRDPEELPFAFALARGMNYAQACALRQRITLPDPKDAEKLPAADGMTNLVKEEVLAMRSEEELIAYVRESSLRLGKLHETAFSLFEQYMRLLERAEIDDLMDEEASMPTSEILRLYLNRDLVPQGKAKKAAKSGLREPQQDALRLISSAWPDATTISKMRSRSLDVTRKLMILLFLATDGGTGAEEDEDWEDDIEEEETREDVFRSVYTRMNRMLAECGFRQLDARNPFDWMILYCISADCVFDIDSQLRQVLEHLFQEEREIN